MFKDVEEDAIFVGEQGWFKPIDIKTSILSRFYDDLQINHTPLQGKRVAEEKSLIHLARSAKSRSNWLKGCRYSSVWAVRHLYGPTQLSENLLAWFMRAGRSTTGIYGRWSTEITTAIEFIRSRYSNIIEKLSILVQISFDWRLSLTTACWAFFHF